MLQKMDIEGQQPTDRVQNRSSSLDKYRLSVKSRKSNESYFSIGGTHYHEYPATENQKMSLQSNISAKAQLRFNNHDLFQNLAYQQGYGEEMRDEGSLRPKWRPTQGERSVQGMVEKMSMEAEGSASIAVSCKCPKSKCLLMYCECFSKDVMCNEKCSCYQCRNNPDFEEKRQKARKAVIEKDPTAFMNKLELVGEQSELALKKGCNCKKTNCSKKYCECFFTGVKCTYLCNCDNCMNGGTNTFKS